MPETADDTTAKHTRVLAWHQDHNATMAIFGGYRMPLWYPAGAKREHLAVLTTAGLFDTSHMAALALEGPAAFDLLQFAFTKDLARCGSRAGTPLAVGRCAYGAFLDDDGGVVDDAIVYRLADQRFLVVVNAGMGAVVAGHLEDPSTGEVTITDLSDRLGKLDVQGPQAARVMASVLADPDTVFAAMPYFSFKGSPIGGAPAVAAVRLAGGGTAMLARTGYTGEFGFELFTDPARFAEAMKEISELVNLGHAR
jgi:aminomethyltransferase